MRKPANPLRKLTETTEVKRLSNDPALTNRKRAKQRRF